MATKEFAPPKFSERLSRYLQDIDRAGSEAGRAFLFLEFVRDVFKNVNMEYLENLYPDLEKHIKLKSKTLVVRGRPDAFLGNLIIEFKGKLSEISLEEAKSELKRYVAILWSKQTKLRTPYLTIATDGERFIVYRPRTAITEGKVVPPEEIVLDEIDRTDLKQTKPGDAFVWLDRYVLYRTLRPATAEDFSREFSLNMPAFKEAAGLLTEAWKQVRETTLYDQWASSLRVVYGSSVESEELFIKHTYLATLAKLLAYSSFSGGALPVSDEQIAEILEGKIFSEKWGVHNFLEEDFFSWVARAPTGLRAARMMLERLASYDLSAVDEDILKTLYQDLVDPEARHDLGEYYTPDWLAEYMVQAVLTKPTKSVIDPACGSGTFLAAVIRKKKSELKDKLAKDELLEHILETVRGVDVHPLAVILSRTTYLISIGTELLSSRKGSIAIPVYMADSIRLPEEEVDISHGIECYRIKADGRFIRIPRKVAEDPSLTDVAVDAVREYAGILSKGEKPDEEAFANLLFQRIPSLAKDTKSKALAKSLYETSKTMAQLIEQKRDTVWAFILKNIYKPLFLREHKFDVVIGNPPWISYRYIESTDYQAFLKKLIMEYYALLPSARAELITQLEIATLFFLRCCDLYLQKDGTIAFVMPRAIFVSDQHDTFRSGTFKSEVRISKLIDLEEVKPLFKVPACVVVGERGEHKFPVHGVKVRGKLPRKNVRLSVATQLLEFSNCKFKLYRIGVRSFVESEEFEDILKAIKTGQRSAYYESFTQGATIVPRQLWFVEPVVHPRFGIDPNAPQLKTSIRAMRRAKEQYKDVKVEGRVESRFLYLVATGSELVPFGHLNFPLSVLPIEPLGNSFRIVTSREASTRGFSHLKSWLQKAESVWTGKRGEKAGKLNIYARLDYQKGLTSQTSKAKFKVLYNTSGTYLVSCIVDSGPLEVIFNGVSLKVSGIVGESTTYFYDTDNEKEALYLCAFLNAPTIDRFIKPMQSKGGFGERHIHKKVLELPIPKFNPRNELHKSLVELAKKCGDKVEKKIPDLANKYTNIGKIRQLIKEELESEIAEIDRIVKRILLQCGLSMKNLDDFV
jgi:hypothetical protein